MTKERTVEFSKPYERKNEKTNARQKLFRVEEVVNEDYITEKVLNNILKAGEDQADILVFPEMLGTRQMLDKIKKSLLGREREIPFLIVFPSIWEKQIMMKETKTKAAYVCREKNCSNKENMQISSTHQMERIYMRTLIEKEMKKK